MCGWTFAWHLAFKTWIPNAHQFWQSALKDHERSSKISRPYHCEMCGWTFARHSALKTWIPNTHINSSFKGHERWNKISRPYHCQMCGCTFAWHSAFKTWNPNKHQFCQLALKGHERWNKISRPYIPLSDVWMNFCLTFSFQDLNSQRTSILTISFERPWKVKQDISAIPLWDVRMNFC